MRKKLDERNNQLYRDPASIIGQEALNSQVDPRLLQYKIQGKWTQTLKKLGINLLVSREYEHFLLSLGATQSCLSLPHPSGIAVDRKNKTFYVASTRNPNQIYTFKMFDRLMTRNDKVLKNSGEKLKQKVFLPVQSFFYPGSFYLHDLAFCGGHLYANAVGHNAILKIHQNGAADYAWWPRCVEQKGKPDSRANYLQLNSISGEKAIKECFFTASSDRILSSRPGDLNFPVDRKGVLFSGKTRQPVCCGLTRPHSARFYKGKIWLDNSGYGEFGFVEKNKFRPIIKLPGWTRGLAIVKDVAFVGTSRVISRFAQYAPGLDLKTSRCGIHAVDLKSGRILGSIIWPYGNQIFAVEWFDQNWQAEFSASIQTYYGYQAKDNS